ncbi:MAG: glycosyltransferase [bacterium]
MDKSFIKDKDLVRSIRNKLKQQNKKIPYNTRPRIFIAVKNINWEKAGLVDSWNKIADVVHYDWGEEYNQYSLDWHTIKKNEFNNILLEKVKEAHLQKPIHIFFGYLSGRWVFRETIQQINEMGIITINFGFDDTSCFWGKKETTGWSGNGEIASIFDVCITAQSRKDVEKYLSVGATPLFVPPGANEKVFGKERRTIQKNIPVSFIGQNYGIRTGIIEMLKKNGIPVYARGKEWPEGEVSQEEMIRIYHNSFITLGFGYTKDAKAMKGRDFEVPMTGVAYLTTYNEELSNYFELDKEILFYRNEKELLKRVKYYIAHPEETIRIGINARKRALREHTWEKRWLEVLKVLGDGDLQSELAGRYGKGEKVEASLSETDSTCQIREIVALHSKKENLEYPIKKINLVGVFSNKWGVEYHVLDAFQQLGYEIKTFDSRKESLSNVIYSSADITIVLQGHGIPPGVIKFFPKPTVVWYGELIHQRSEIADWRSKINAENLKQNISAFDMFFHHDYSALNEIRELGGKNVFWVSTSGVNPKIHKKIDTPKIYDIGFSGLISPRRQEILNSLQKEGINIVYKSVYGEELNCFINQCKIFLNLHFTELLNTETRLHEILGTGTFALTEEISMPDMFANGKHLIYWKVHDFDDLVKKIKYYLENEDEREHIAKAGYQLVHQHYRYVDRCEKILSIVSGNWCVPILNLQEYDSSLGIMFDKRGQVTNSVDSFRQAVLKELLEKDE